MSRIKKPVGQVKSERMQGGWDTNFRERQGGASGRPPTLEGLETASDGSSSSRQEIRRAGTDHNAGRTGWGGRW